MVKKIAPPVQRRGDRGSTLFTAKIAALKPLNAGNVPPYRISGERLRSALWQNHRLKPLAADDGFSLAAVFCLLSPSMPLLYSISTLSNPAPLVKSGYTPIPSPKILCKNFDFVLLTIVKTLCPQNQATHLQFHENQKNAK